MKNFKRDFIIVGLSGVLCIVLYAHALLEMLSY